MRKEQSATWRKNLKKGIMALGVGASLIGFGSPAVQAAERTGEFEGRPLFDNHFDGIEIDGSTGNELQRRGASYAKKFDPRTTNTVTQIEDQGDTNTCWAFATIAAIESNLIKKGYTDNSINLSENHLAYFFYNRQTDPLGYTADDKNLNLMDDWVDNAGTLDAAALSLATWSGVVKETSSEDNASGGYNPKALPAGDCYKRDYVVKNVYYYDYNIDTIKQAILDHGAVASGIYINEAYWKASTDSYYCTEVNANHAVTIVGWDDNYSKSNFKKTPSTNGAWIVKNSYGTGFGDGGYMYVSYSDKSLYEIVAYDMVPVSEAYQNNYQHDGTANSANYYKLSSGVQCASVFQAKAASGYNEVLKAVSMDVLSENVSYEIQVYTGMTSSSPASGKAVYSKKQTGKLTNAGYNMIELTRPVTLAAGERYAVVVTLKSSDGGTVSVACDTTYYGQWISFASAVGKGQSYVKMGSGAWQDMGEIENANLRLKAYTDNTKQKASYKLSSTSLGISKGTSSKLSLVVTNGTSRKVTWTTSNKNVATVSNGTVKGKSYGTATIKAKFTTGSKIKTLTCKVTVGPSKVKNMKVKASKKKLTVTWKANSSADGYQIQYSKKKESGYKALTTITKGSKSKYIKKKMASGTYYVKMRPYLNKEGKKLYGSFTAVKRVTVK